MGKSILNSKLAYKVKNLYQIGIDKHEKLTVNCAMDTENFCEIIDNIRPTVGINIAFIIQGIARYSGGITSILRLGTYLEKKGRSISYLDFSYQNIKEAEDNAKFNLENYSGKIKNYYDEAEDAYDIVIATSWESFYRINKFNAYKMYFVQDYEPYFSKYNEKFLLAKKTYELGAHIVSLGSWNIDMIRKECVTSSILDVVSFPYEPSEYSMNLNRNYKEYFNKNTIKIAVYTKEEGKRIPNILQYLLEKAYFELEKDNIILDIYFFGLNDRYRVSIGKNLGKIHHNELIKLYCECDFGMCASMSNISLVPYEMLATGLPIFEFKDGSYSNFLPRESATLIDYNYKNIVDNIKKMLDNPSIIEEQVRIGKEAIKNLSWENTATEFDKIIDGIVEK